MAAVKDLEKSLNDIFVNKAPALPPKVKKTIVEYLPWINLALGVFALWAAYGLWHWAHIADRLIDYTNSLNQLYGAPVLPTNRLSATVWLGLAILVIEAIIYIAAFPATRARKKSGWDLLFYALLVNVVYGLAVLFTDHGGFASLVSSVIGSAVGMYFLFQIREEYLGKSSKPTTASVKKA